MDAFPTNMFGHPYGGGFYYNAGRENGVGFWGSAALTFLGSGLWEYFGETERPALNDLYMTGFGGVVYGEVGHRIGDVIRDNCDNRASGAERVVRELVAFPFDPVSTVHRVLSGGFMRVAADPEDRDRTPLAAEFQIGAKLAIDSGAARPRSVSPTILAYIAYGDAFGVPYRQPFDVFRVRLQFSPGGGGMNQMRARGRLYGYSLTDREAALRHVFTVALKSEYLASPAFHFGGQSLEAGFLSDLAVAPNARLQTEVFAEWMLLGGLDAPGSGVRERTYDFGPGLGDRRALRQRVSRRSLDAVPQLRSGGAAQSHVRSGLVGGMVPAEQHLPGHHRRDDHVAGVPRLSDLAFPAPGRGAGWGGFVKTARVIAAAAGLLVLAALPAEAQARSRTGFWLDGLVSSARLKLVCNTCSDDVHATGTVVTISAGGTPGRGLLLGVEAQVWTGADAGVGQRVRSVALITQWYPWDAGFYLPAAPDSPTGVWLPRTRQRRARRSTAGGSCSHLPWGTIWR